MIAALEPLYSHAPAVDIAAVVERLADLRRQAQRRRYLGPTPQLPSRQSLLALADSFLSVVYPRHFSAAANDDLDAHVAQTLAKAAPALEREIARELALPHGANANRGWRDPAAIAAEFIEELPRVREQVDLDIRAALAAEPAQGAFDELVFCSAAVAAILRHRLAHNLYRLGAPLAAKIMAADVRSRTGVDIHPGAEIGEGFVLANTGSLTIDETAVIGRNVRLAAPVTLGESFSIASGDRDALDAPREGSPSGRRHPLIEDDVVIEAGASLFGPITVGRGAVIGRNVWVLSDVAPGSRIEAKEA